MMEAIKEGDKPPCNLGHFKTLNAAGAFDSTGGRAERCEQCEGTGRWKPDPAVRKREPCPECGATGFVAVAVPGADELAKGQKEYLGVVLVDLYAGLMEKHADRLGKLDPFERANGEDGIAKVPGVVKEVKKTKTKHGASMGFATITWEGEEARVAVFPDAWEQYQFALKEGALGEFTLKATERGPQLQKVFKLV
jgi:DNA polymerase III alpha subunit